MGSAVRRLPKNRAKGSRYFVGFGDAEINALVASFDSRVQSPPIVTLVKNARLLPLGRVMRGFFTGGVADDVGYLPALSLHRGYAAQRVAHVTQPQSLAVPPGAERLKRAWFGGYLFNHYGHFLLEGLARVLHRAIAKSDEPIVFFNPAGLERLPSYMSRVFEQIGIDIGRIVLCGRAPLLIDALRVQEPTFEIRGLIRPALYAHAKFPAPPGRKSGSLYLSRSRLARQRTVRGEEPLEDALGGALGTRIAYPETLSLHDQIALIGNAKMVAGCEGSAFHTLIFLRSVPRAVMLCNRPPHINYLLCDETVDGDTIYVQAARKDGGPNQRTDWEIDAEAVLPLLGALADTP